MWPFSRKVSNKPTPTIKVGETLINWRKGLDWWELVIDGTSYSLTDNPVFDTQIIDELPRIRQWINDLDAEIDKEIAEQLDGWCEWDGKKEIVSIDVSSLLEENRVDVSYAGNDNWGDLGVNIVIVAGKIDHVYSGD